MKTRLYFDTGKITHEQWLRIDKECDYEVMKATASAPPGVSREAREEELYIQCVELRGARFKSKARVPA
jgi:hypothetical protein